MASFLRDILTGHGSTEFDSGRVLWVIAMLSLVVYQGVALATKNQPFDPIAFGTGAAALLAAGGVGIAVKDRGIGGTSVQGDLKAQNVENVSMGAGS